VSEWRFEPFSPTIVDGMLYGRGSADMKGSLAAMIVAAERFLSDHDGSFSIGFLLTSDEEGPAVNGTRRVVETLAERGTAIDYCVIGEPSSTAVVGDMIRIGRRGSLNARLTLKGVQGHVAYPDLARNPVHLGLPLLSRLVAERWDEGNDEFPPTSFQISNVAAGTGATNVIPGHLQVDFNLRFSTEQTAAGLEARIERLCRESGLPYRIDWSLSGEPFLTRPGRLLDAVDQEISRMLGTTPEHSTGGGTSDGRFIARLDCELVELGPVNATIHQVDEHVEVADLTRLCDIHQALLKALLL
jgi:succinyl-diaminopimelate desuccinylase